MSLFIGKVESFDIPIARNSSSLLERKLHPIEVSEFCSVHFQPFSRSAAGKSKPSENECRSVKTLVRATQALFQYFEKVQKRQEMNVESYDFLLDRFRAIRQEFTLQDEYIQSDADLLNEKLNCLGLMAHFLMYSGIHFLGRRSGKAIIINCKINDDEVATCLEPFLKKKTNTQQQPWMDLFFLWFFPPCYGSCSCFDLNVLGGACTSTFWWIVNQYRMNDLTTLLSLLRGRIVAGEQYHYELYFLALRRCVIPTMQVRTLTSSFPQAIRGKVTFDMLQQYLHIANISAFLLENKSNIPDSLFTIDFEKKMVVFHNNKQDVCSPEERQSLLESLLYN